MTNPMTGANPQNTLIGPNSGMWPKPLNAFAHGTYRPVPHGMPFIAGDVQKDGKPNPEIILPTPDGNEVIPIKDLPKHAEGTMPKSKAPPVPLPSPKKPTHGMDDFYRLNPKTPTAAAREVEKVLTNPNIPMPIRLPKLAYGTFSPNASAMSMPMGGMGLYDVSDGARRRRQKMFQDSI